MADANAPAHIKGLSMIDKRRIEAEILKHVYDELKASHGVAVAQRTIGEAVRRSAVEQAERFAAQSPEGTSLQAFIDMQALWTQDGALEIEEVGRSADTYAFNVTRCRYSEMYKAMGLGEIGHLLSCQRDGTFCEGYDKRLKLDRTQTIMQGASHCDFRFRYEDGKAG
ncbi:L-2-amino-thiazoline-4-carboxylic acid hydrolase [Phreatobacter sp. AB_2022a]|uniref:L-2-amino-thiazoline-4-carboxylic acid hydrolase n=1 Tax=Phreatobacter sp. AB_2022a TaxID=3003134 RepID=UPI0022874377|nr:L-2-amino-thiazoline-4-carboxylic acid hydrolase [Phreatobacter sp. AB_2022a]MCZ0735696.1 L-2-amino-thiazoline-4-carboxylic acid hydrolase [Phreatobacter sp. AB_2022a]